jgi:predicted nucleic acid-binding protein
MSVPVVVIDASVGVKWFIEEAGSDEAASLLRRHGNGEIRLAVPAVFMHEILDVARRRQGPDHARRVLDVLAQDEVMIAGAGAGFLRRALDVCERLGCSVYDAAAPALAELLDAELVSADRRAHGGYPGVRIIG